VATFAETFTKGEMRSVCSVDNTVWTCGSNGQLAVYDSNNFSCTEKRQIVPIEDITALACINYDTSSSYSFESSTYRMWMGFMSGALAVFSRTLKKEHEIAQAHIGEVNQIIQVGNYAWTCSEDRHVKHWDTLTLTLIRKFDDHKAPVKCMCLVSLDNYDHQIWTASTDLIKIRDVVRIALLEVFNV